MLGRPGSDAPVRLQSKPGSSYRMADYLVFVILGIERDGFNYVSPADFWETAVGGAEEEDLRTAEFLQGFIEGALEVEHVVIEYDAATLDP